MARFGRVSTRNAVSGYVGGSVVQAGTISGDLHVHGDPARPVVPRQLPPGPEHFSGRAEELDALNRVPADLGGREGPGVVVVSGTGGVGKTALALHWIHDRADLFPDGQLYSDLSAFGPGGPADPGRVLGTLLRGLGVTSDRIPSEEADRAALFRSVTADKAIALLFDDAASTEQVRVLLPASGRSVVVVTSRSRLSGLLLRGGSLLPLEPLRDDEAAALMTRTLGSARVADEPQSAMDLVGLCGGLPIALRVAVARLASRPRWRLARVVRDLAGEPRRLSAFVLDGGGVSVEATFDLSYRDLPAGAARMYRVMALHPGTEFGAEVAAAATGLSADDAGDLLDLLVDASMVTDVGEDRFRLHDLIRLHALGWGERHDTEPRRRHATRAMGEWYLGRAVSADSVVTPLRRHLGDRYATRAWTFATAGEALDWLEDELPNLMAVLRSASADHGDDLVWQLCEAMWGLFLYRGFHAEWIEACEAGAGAAARMDNPVAESRMLVQLAAGHLRLGHLEAALRSALLAWDRAHAAEDWRGEATALESLGSIAHASGKLDEAIDHYRCSLALNEEHGSTRGVALLLCYLGYAMSDIGDHEGAARHFARSMRTAASIGDLDCQAQALVGLGSSRAREGHFEQALVEMTEGLAMLSPAAPALRVDVLDKLGEVALMSGDRDAARGHWERALDLFSTSRHPKADRVRARLASLRVDVADTA